MNRPQSWKNLMAVLRAFMGFSEEERG